MSKSIISKLADRDYYPIVLLPEEHYQNIKEIIQKNYSQALEKHSNSTTPLKVTPIRIKRPVVILGIILLTIFLLIIIWLGFRYFQTRDYIYLAATLFFSTCAGLIRGKINNYNKANNQERIELDSIEKNSNGDGQDKLQLQNKVIVDINSYLSLNRNSRLEALREYEKLTEVVTGASEEYFLSYLEKCFPDRLTVSILRETQFSFKLTPKKPYGTPVSPDFLLIFNDLGVGIDLEIDEPYSFDKKNSPCHQRENNWYPKRDSLFLGLEVIVVRLTEYQVLFYPEQCCSLILGITQYYYSGRINLLNKVLRELPLIDSWSENESKIMSRNKVRQRWYSELNLNEKAS